MSASRRSLDVDSLSHIRGIPYQRTLSLRYMLHSVPARAFTQVYAVLLTSACFHSGICSIPCKCTLLFRYTRHYFHSSYFHSSIRGKFCLAYTYSRIHLGCRHTRHSFQMQAFTQVCVAFYRTLSRHVFTWGYVLYSTLLRNARHSVFHSVIDVIPYQITVLTWEYKHAFTQVFWVFYS